MMRKIAWMLLAWSVTLYLSLAIWTPEAAVPQYTSDQLIRLHVIANSDDPADQALKLDVKDKIVEMVKSEIQADSVGAAREQIQERLDLFAQVAEGEIASQGKSYPVRVVLGQANFPTKYYGSFSLPAGQYEALRVIIGDGQGQNWWCVLFPPLCFVDNQTATASISDLDLKKIPSNDIVVRFRFLEVGKKLFDKIVNIFKPVKTQQTPAIAMDCGGFSYSESQTTGH